MDKHGNIVAIEGVDRCTCGVKYWEGDRCIDCKSWVWFVVPKVPAAAALLTGAPLAFRGVR